MWRYGVARYLTPEQIERAATARYGVLEIDNWFDWGCCTAMTLPATRTEDGACPLGVALDGNSSLHPCEVEDALSSGVSPRINRRRLNAIWRFVRDVDHGRIGPGQVAEALGYRP